MPNTTKRRMEDGTKYFIIQCNDCGAFKMNGIAQNIKHHSSCTPTKPEWFETKEEHTSCS